jgi:hypothetical protein
LNYKEHKERHKMLHARLDELVADWIGQTKCLPSTSTVADLMKWSHEQTIAPTELRCREARPLQPCKQEDGSATTKKWLTLEEEFALKPLPRAGKCSHYTLEHFIKNVEDGDFVDDGFGYYATAERMSNVVIRPSDVANGVDRRYTHVVWFNR